MKKSKRSLRLRKLHSLIFLSLPLSTIGILTCINAVKAQQVTPDGTVSTTVITPDGKNFNINDGTIRGTNLFHSFKEFSVPTGGSANFNNAANIQNIISRVTGGSISTIDGLIRTLGKANLFLLNPAGIIFGPNAQLNIGGSFLGSTANSFLFDNGFEFSATDPQAPPLLTINVPIGLGFRNNPQNITSQSAGLEVPQENSIALVGGNVSLNGGILFAPGGRIELGGLSTAGTVGLNGDGSLSFPVGVQRADVSLTNRAIAYVQGGGGGNIAVNARNLDLLGGSLLYGGIQPGLGTPGAQAGDIKIDATDKVKIAGTTSSFSGIFNITGFGSNITEPGNAGNIVINTGTLEGNGYIFISSGTNGQGNAGRVQITAKDKVSLTGESVNSFASVGSLIGSSGIGNGADIVIDTRSLSLSNTALSTFTLGQGNAGNIQVKASESISVTNNSQLTASTSGRGNAGNIVIDAVDAAVSFDANTIVGTGVYSTSTGKGGDITIKARNLSANNGASLSTSTFGQAEAGRLANAGNIQVNVLEDISFKGGSYLISGTLGQGNAGNVSVSAGGKISFDGIRSNGSTSSRSGIFSNVGTGAEGNAGNINISGQSVSLTNNAGVNSSSTGQGNAGNITVLAQDTISVANSLITNNVGSPERQPAKGNVGNIVLEARVVSFNGAELQAGLYSGAQGNPGIVSVQARDSISFGTDSGIFTDVEFGAVGNGSDIQISAQSVSFKDNAVLKASNAGQGNAGNILVRAQDTISADNRSLILSNVGSREKQPAKGNVGNIVLEARVVSLSNNAQLQAGLYSGAQGNPGIVSVRATDSISFVGTNSGIFTDVESGAVGNGSDIQISAQSVSFKDSAILKASNAGQGNGGNIAITADSVFFDNSFAVSRLENSGMGNAGSIDFNARSLSLTNGGAISTSNVGNGAAGNIKVTTAKDIRLDNKAFIEANTNGGQGNITLNSFDLILRNNSSITTNATNTADGGNININTGNLVALENSKITANAQQGYGGNIIITTNGGRFLSPDSVISATSEAGPQFSGTVQFNTPPNDPSRGLFQFPETVTDPAQQIAQNVCTKGFASSFVITGRGGIPTDPTKILSSDNVRVDLVKPVPSTVSSTSATQKQPSKSPTVKEIIPARGWIYNEKGEVLLVGYDPTKTGPQRQPQTPASSCAVVK